MSRITNSLRFRAHMARFGVYYFKHVDASRVRVGGRNVRFSFPDSERVVLDHEVGSILFRDCYGLGTFEGVSSVLDIGANVGIFSVAARHFYSGAVIHAYEPNPDVIKHLAHNAGSVDAVVHSEAVGRDEGMVVMDVPEDGSMHAVAVASTTGVKQIAFRNAMDRIGTSVDLVKLDCEGAEWEIFEDADTWGRVKHLTMEYHLWARPELSVGDLCDTIKSLGFRITHLSESPNGPWGFLRASK